MRSLLLKLLALLMVFGLVAAACGNDDDDGVTAGRMSLRRLSRLAMVMSLSRLAMVMSLRLSRLAMVMSLAPEPSGRW